MNRHFFAGGNTRDGFFSFFEHLIDPQNADTIYILKGGSGVGKSSLMKKFGTAMSDRGHSCEFAHCSSDESSLDAVVIPELGIAMQDGTAPHMADPRYPGACEIIVNLGDFLNSLTLKEHKSEIVELSRNKSECYKSAYHFIASAQLLLDENMRIYESFLLPDRRRTLTSEICNLLFSSIPKKGGSRHLFSEVFTKSGFVDFGADLFASLSPWLLVGGDDGLYSRVLWDIANAAILKGHRVELFHHPIEPKMLQHIVLTDLGIAVLSRAYGVPEKIIDFENAFDRSGLASENSVIERNRSLANVIFALAASSLGESARLHGKLESLYSDAMDFPRVDTLLGTILDTHLSKGGSEI